jgi:hypothetical protein
MDCTKSSDKPATLTAGDESSARHFKVSRKISAEAPVDLDICAADVTVKAGHDDTLNVIVNFDGAAPKAAADYLKALDISPQAVGVKLYLPKTPRAKVQIVLPGTIPKLKINLVRGNLTFETDRIAGERSINVISGDVDILANPDAYANLHSSVLMGSFYDRRTHESSHGTTSKSLAGTGKGSIDINVVRGNVDLKAWD